MALGKKSYPLFYYSRGSDARNKERCDLTFVMQRMKHIPEPLKDSVSHVYDGIMLSGDRYAREMANTWLNAVALQFGGYKRDR